MKRLALALPLALLAAGCAHPAYVSPVEITRFIGEAPMALGRGTFAIAPAPGVETDTIEYAAYADVLRAELAMLGYAIVEEGAEQTAIIALESSVADTGRARSPVGVGVGGSTGSYGSGVGVGVGINLNSLSGPPPETIERRLSVAIRFTEGERPNLWEGRAQMGATSNSDYAATALAAQRMMDALFTNFPGTSGETMAID